MLYIPVTISFQNHTLKAPDVTFLAYDMKHTGTTYLIDSLEVYIYFFIINCKLSEKRQMPLRYPSG